MRRRKRSIASRVGAGLLLATVVALVGFGLHRVQTLPLMSVDVSGAVHADDEALLALAAVPDSVRLFGIDVQEVASRVEQAPWVETARVTRRMTGTLAIHVRERRPVALALERDGRPGAFLDAGGHVMPITPSSLRAGYDLPLLTGRLPQMHPGRRVEDAPIRALLATLAELGPIGDALVSAVERQPDGTLVLHTAPTPAGDALPVVLGRDGFARKMRRLEAFWDQVILARPEHPIKRIDLRFDGQIVTNEGA